MLLWGQRYRSESHRLLVIHTYIFELLWWFKGTTCEMDSRYTFYSYSSQISRRWLFVCVCVIFCSHMEDLAYYISVSSKFKTTRRPKVLLVEIVIDVSFLKNKTRHFFASTNEPLVTQWIPTRSLMYVHDGEIFVVSPVIKTQRWSIQLYKTESVSISPY